MDIINSTMYIVCKAFQSTFVAIFSTIQNFKLPAICLGFSYRNLIFNELNFQQDKRNILSKKMRMKVTNKCAVNIDIWSKVSFNTEPLKLSYFACYFLKFLDDKCWKYAFSKELFFQNIYRSGFIDKRIQARMMKERQKIKWNVWVLHTVKHRLTEYVF